MKHIISMTQVVAKKLVVVKYYRYITYDTVDCLFLSDFFCLTIVVTYLLSFPILQS